MIQTETERTSSSTNISYDLLFRKQQAQMLVTGNSSAKTRIEKLNRLLKAVRETYRTQIQEALYKDFGKPHTETDLTEIYPIVKEIKHTRKHLHRWMRKQRVETPLTLMGTSSWYRYESKGVCLILSPWNFPLNLTFGPLVSAIAAGNTVILKPSEMTPHIAGVMQKIIEDLYREEEIAMVQGDADTAKALLDLPFNHIFFTGSPGIGKKVMAAAAKNLSSVTLELGGKSPVIVDESANLKVAAKRIAWGKYMNAGQICVSPDYLLIHHSAKADFLKLIEIEVQKFFTSNPKSSGSYSRIVNQRHYDRLMEHLEDAEEKNGVTRFGGKSDAAENYISPTVIEDLPEDASLMQEEIFGPVLPVKTYKELEEVIAYINSKERPLALYIYSRRKKNINKILGETRAGSSCINSNVLQYANQNLPFGGVNNSGIGKSNGIYGFREFSNQRAVLKQYNRGIIQLLFPPYTSWKQKIAIITLKWF
ncbi:aldehyde dehydrogenase family protein [Zeaxanthinibacter enoshimensis]|uniref:Aldehyde dehydrogenase n=1 Tax=Zeaxanthinibacter enoshimensis TaxID=392009 RepID=A0A4R6TLL7_9FLAO|nr:aldehyde dehydrogenase family protein [Zeaxanthinibacter enoshimensis]TDQ30688.1 aldehyde dehydrogenase (NAD+) [Zeaxanthinibacter enoshimensis]